MEIPTADDEVKGLKLTLKEQKKQVQKSILANDVKRSDYDRLRARSAQAKSSLATAEQKLAAAETMLKNAREFSGTIEGSCTHKSKRYRAENEERVKTIRLADDLVLAIEGAMNGGSDSDFPSQLAAVEKELEHHEGKAVFQRKNNRLGLSRAEDAAKVSLVRPGKQCVYVVKAGDHAASIAQKFDCAETDLRRANPNLEDLFDHRMKLTYPPVGTYVVVPRKFIVTSKLKGTCTLFQNAVENVTEPFNAHAAMMGDKDSEKGEQRPSATPTTRANWRTAGP